MIMVPLYIIVLFSLFFLYSFIDIVRKDIFFGGIYGFLFIYTFFTQIGYAYFPELSIIIKAYFGPTIFYRYIIFLFLSFILFYLTFKYFNRIIIRDLRYNVIKISVPMANIIFSYVILYHLIFICWFIINNYNIINYANASNEDFVKGQGLIYIIFAIAFKMSVVINLVLYILYRNRLMPSLFYKYFVVQLMLLFELIIFIVISMKIGSRTDLLALSLGIIVYELKTINKHSYLKTIFKITIITIVVLYGSNIIENIRSDNVFSDRSLSYKILLQDYYAPSHILIAAMEYNYVNLKEVFVSNILNSLILMNYPYLQTTVADIFNPGSSTRTASYAFYIFSEGYIALGWLGIIYNSVVVILGVSIWRGLASSNNNHYNMFMISLVSTQMANIARSQSSYFIKDIYTIFIPGMILFFMATGLVPKMIGTNLKKVSEDKLFL